MNVLNRVHPLDGLQLFLTTTMQKRGALMMLQAAVFGLLIAALIAPAYAGTSGDEIFGEAYRQIAGFTQGFLGKLVTLLMVVSGLIMGIARQSIMTLVVGVGMGIALYNTPNIVNALVGAVI